jgi:hypothetical protein
MAKKNKKLTLKDKKRLGFAKTPNPKYQSDKDVTKNQD